MAAQHFASVGFMLNGLRKQRKNTLQSGRFAQPGYAYNGEAAPTTNRGGVSARTNRRIGGMGIGCLRYRGVGAITVQKRVVYLAVQFDCHG